MRQGFRSILVHHKNRFMKKSIVRIFLLALIQFYFIFFLQAQTAKNPIIFADVPDMSMVRVGDTYYMSSTTMHLSPGLPIIKSRDLVNWQLVGYAYDRLAENDALTLPGNRPN